MKIISRNKKIFSKRKDKIFNKKESKIFAKKKIKPLFLIVGSLIFLFSLFLILLKINANSGVFKIKNISKDVGVCKVLKGVKNNANYNFSFPSFNDKQMDKEVINILREELFAFLKENKNNKKIKIESDYGSFSFNENAGVSVCLQFLKTANSKKTKTVRTLNFCYKEKLNTNNVFLNEQIPKIVTKIKSEIRSNFLNAKKLKKQSIDLDKKITNSLNSLRNFLIKKDTITFYYNAGEIFSEKEGIFFVEISNDFLKDYFSPKYSRFLLNNSDLKNLGRKNFNGSLVALTFDDGPDAETTGEILDVLEKYDAKATFFVVGKQAKQFPEVLKRQIANGHEIANHTFSHANLKKLSTKGIENEIFKTDKIVSNATGFVPKFVRAPYGNVNSKVKDVANKPFIYWSVDTRDWETRNTQSTINSVLKNASDGDIILMHDIYPTTAKAVETIVKELTNRGFNLVTVSEMFKLKNIPLEKGKQYTSAKETEE